MEVVQQQHEVESTLSQRAVPCCAVLWCSVQVAADARPKRITLSVDRTIKVGRVYSIHPSEHQILQLSMEAVTGTCKRSSEGTERKQMTLCL
jgi:hypothetical protein